MASTTINVPCNVGAINVLDCRNFKPELNRNFVSVRPPIRVSNGRRGGLIVRASETREGPIKKTGLSDEECEAAVVAGNAPEAPPVAPKPAAPAGTPVVPSLVSVLWFFFLGISIIEIHKLTNLQSQNAKYIA